MPQTVVLEGGHPWGFRITGGEDLGRPITITKVIFGSKAYNQGLRAGDVVERVNGEDAHLLTSTKAKHFIRTAGQRLVLELRKTSKPSTIPEIRITKVTTKSNKVTNKDTSSVLQPPLVDVSDEKRETEDKMLIVAPGSPLETKKKPTGALANGEEEPHVDQTSAPTTVVWAPFGKSSISPLKTYKPVTFCPVSSSSSSVSSQSSFSGSPVKSSPAGSSSAASASRTSKVTTAIVNGTVPEVSIAGEGEGNSRNSSSSMHSGSLVFSPSSVDGKPVVSSLVPDWKPTKSATSTISWKPPVSAAVELKSTADLNPPSSFTPERKPPVSFLGKNNPPVTSTDSVSTLSISSDWKPVSVVSSSSVKFKPPATSAEKTSATAGWKNFQVSESKAVDKNSSESFSKSATLITKAEPIDTTIFDKELTEDWWDSLFNEAQKAEAAAAAAAEASAAAAAGLREDDYVSYSKTATRVKDSTVAPLSSTAAVLHLSSSLGDAIQNASEAELMTNSYKQTTFSTQPNKGPRKPMNNEILQEWRSGFYDSGNSSNLTIQQEYDHLQELHRARSQSSHPKTSDGEVRTNRTSDRTNGRASATTTDAMEQQEVKDNRTSAPRDVRTPIPVKFEGIGPTDEKTGVPIATRVSIDEKNRKDWYRRMYASLHKPEKPASSGRPTVNGDVKDQQRMKSPSPPGAGRASYYPPHAKYKSERYRNQPLRIEDYEPGYHSSIALKDHEADPNRFFESDAEIDYRNEDIDLVTTELLGALTDGRQVERPGVRRNGTSTVVRSKSFNRKTARQQRDEENQKRKQEIEAVMTEERRRRFAFEQKQNEARRHKDLYTPVQKTTFLLNRFSDDEIGGMAIQRPKQVKAIKMRGKAKALYTFKAQNNTELSFKKGDIIYLLRQIDKNWYQGEHNGIVGIFPVAYVEVIMSLEEAKTMALQREGKAIAKFNFKSKTSAELTLEKGAVVRLIRKVDQNWYEGRIGNQQGIFPVSFVETVQEPDTPMMTPSPSAAAPMPVPGHLSPTSSVHSGGPEIPSAPVSPWNSDFYESEFEPELRDITSKSQSHPPSGTRSSSAHQKMESSSRRDAPLIQAKPRIYFTFPAQTNARTKATNAAPIPSEKSKKDLQNAQGEKDLFVLARNRRANAGNVLEARSASLGDDLEKISKPASLEPLGKSLSFDFGQRKNFSKSTKSSSYSRYTVLYDYTPKNLDELELKEGDTVCVMEKCDDGWYVGFSETTDEFGTFPGNYVERLS